MKKSITLKMVFQLLFIVYFSANAYGQDNTKEIAKDEIIKKSWKAMFGESKSEDIKSIYFENQVKGRTEPSISIVKRPNHFRNEIPVGIAIFNGKRGALIQNDSTEGWKNNELKILETTHWRDFEVDIAFKFPAYFDYQSKYGGRDIVNGKENFKIIVELPLGGVVTYFLDTKTFFITKQSLSWIEDSSKVVLEMFVTKYKNYNGILFPEGYYFEGRKGKVTRSYNSIKFNINPKDELFEIPDELK